MATTREEIIEQAKDWLGKKESDGSFKVIIDTYNNHKPLPRNYKVKYTDEWCATFISALGIKCNATDIILKECSCQKLIELHKINKTWVEDDGYCPKPGDIIFYDWQDSGIGDNTGWSDHVGIVVKVVGHTITVIEGNLDGKVATRTIQVNGKYIRGYAVPKYLVKTVTPKKEYLNLHPTSANRTVYNTKYVKVGTLNPKKYKGLSYEILGYSKDKRYVKIKTSYYGNVLICIDKKVVGKEFSITTTKKYK